MKICISSTDIDSDDKLVSFQIIAETTKHKTTLKFYGYADTFDDFASSLQQFPFDSKKPVKFEIGDWDKSAYGLMLLIELVDDAGHIKFIVHTRDNRNDESALFSDTVETMALDNLSQKLKASNFITTSEINWQS